MPPAALSNYDLRPPTSDREQMAKVLVVEDEPSAVAVVRYHFENAGFEGIYASDADEGWRMLVGDRPDAMVTDTGVSGGDGWSLVERVRRDNRFQALPVVVLADQVERETAGRAGPLRCEFLTKPFSASALLEKLDSLLTLPSESDDPIASGGPDSRRVDLVPVGVVIFLDNYRVQGTIHLPPELARFSDAWESVVRDPRAFFPVTRARLMSRDGATVLSSPAFVEIRKSDVRAVFPQDLTPVDNSQH
jgi:CheY-like chemotaxis protein